MMSCGCSCQKAQNEEKFKTATLAFGRKSLLYDIGNILYIEGDARKTTDEKEKSQVIDGLIDGNIDRITRVLNLSFNEMAEWLYELCKYPMPEGIIINDVFREACCYELPIKVHDTFSKTSLIAVEEAVHEYMVDRAVYDWLSITYVDKAQIWYAKAEEMKERILEYLSHELWEVNTRILDPF